MYAAHTPLLDQCCLCALHTMLLQVFTFDLARGRVLDCLRVVAENPGVMPAGHHQRSFDLAASPVLVSLACCRPDLAGVLPLCSTQTEFDQSHTVTLVFLFITPYTCLPACAFVVYRGQTHSAGMPVAACCMQAAWCMSGQHRRVKRAQSHQRLLPWMWVDEEPGGARSVVAAAAAAAVATLQRAQNAAWFRHVGARLARTRVMAGGRGT